MRKYEIDNLRWICILLLFPYHTFTLYNNWGENYYVRGEPNWILSLFVKICQPWFMPLLFVLAGISAVLSLKRRTPAQYLKERVLKLLVPLSSGILLVVPSLTYFAERFHNGYTGGYFEQYLLFFSETDLVGYTGGFTPAHLWFLAYLLIVSIAALPPLLLCKKYYGCKATSQISSVTLLFFFLIIWGFSYILDINGKSIGRFFALFLLGALFLSREETQQKLSQFKWRFLVLWVLSTAAYLCTVSGLLQTMLFHLASWTGILALLGIAVRYFTFQNALSAYFCKASFPLYVFHLPWVVAIAYVCIPRELPLPMQAAVILLFSFLFTMLTYTLVRRVPPLRVLFAIKK